MKRHHCNSEPIKDGFEVPAAIINNVRKGVDLEKVFKNYKAINLGYHLPAVTAQTVWGGDLVIEMTPPKNETIKKRLFSEIKFDHADKTSGHGTNAKTSSVEDPDCRPTRMQSMGNMMINDQLRLNSQSPEFYEQAFTHDAQNEIFSCEFSKMKTSDIVKFQKQKNKLSNLNLTLELEDEAPLWVDGDFQSMGVSFDEHPLMDGPDCDDESNFRFCNSDSLKDGVEESYENDLFDERSKFQLHYNESDQHMGNVDFVELCNGTITLDVDLDYD